MRWPEDLAAWLVEREERYGGRVEYPELGLAGGDRMAGHGYAPAYARALTPFVDRNGAELVVVEVGVLRGTGLAIWCDLFETVIGLDVDTDRFREFRPALERAGAFSLTTPTVLVFDQREATPERLGELLSGKRPAIVIDDASHVDALTLRTLQAFRPHLADDFLYFVEDSPRGSGIHRELRRDPRGLTAHNIHRTLTVLTP